MKICVYCGDIIGGSDGGYYSIETGHEGCEDSPTGCHEFDLLFEETLRLLSENMRKYLDAH